MTAEQALSLVPRRAPNVETAKDGDDLRIVISRSPHPLARLVSHFMGLPARKTFLLDSLGTRVWEMCDSRNSIHALISRFAQEQEWSRDRAQRAVLVYLSTLSQRRLIAFDQPGSGGERGTEPKRSVKA